MPTTAADRLDTSRVGWLLVSLLLVAAPHAERVPWWITLLVIALFAWRAYLQYYTLVLPRKWLLLLIATSAVIGIYLSYGRVMGRDSGVALLLIMLGLKVLEMATLRDAMILDHSLLLPRHHQFFVLTNHSYGDLHVGHGVVDYLNHDRFPIPYATGN
jgi:hypothetical protein